MPFDKEALINWRKKTGLSQRVLASYLGLSNQTIADWEKGTTIPRAAHLDALYELMQDNADRCGYFEFYKIPERK